MRRVDRVLCVQLLLCRSKAVVAERDAEISLSGGEDSWPSKRSCMTSRRYPPENAVKKSHKIRIWRNLLVFNTLCP